MNFFDYCELLNYSNEIIYVIQQWLKDPEPKIRRAVTEGLRVWTKKKPFLKEPQKAVDFLTPLLNDPSDYVNKSCKNALNDIRKTHPNLDFL